MNKLPDHCSAKLSSRIRFWLIRKLAGGSVVILNARIDMVPQDTPEVVRLRGIHGGLFENVSFPVDHGLILKVGQIPVGGKYVEA